MKKDNKVIGKKGEDLACNYLVKKGLQIVERNFQNKYGEIDIVCMDKDVLVFVEVKTKVGHDFGEPEEMVNKSKLRQVQRMGEIYVLNCELKGTGQGLWSGRCRVDVVAVVLGKDYSIETLRYYEAVY